MRRRWRRRLLRALLGLALAMLLLPPLLVGLYAVLPPPATPLMLLRLAKGEGLERQWTALDRIAPSLRHAVIAGEDNLFCRHAGFDVASLRQAIDDYRGGGRLRGASTISQQTAKNLWLWPGQSLLRKALEAYFTVWLELLLPKRRILELYLNVAEWGGGIYGAEAAARAHFGKPAADLARREAALLAAVLPSPRRWSPAPPGPYVARRADTLLTRVRQLGPLLDCAA